VIGISKLYCGTVEPSDALRYGRRSDRLPSHLLQFSADKRPVVVWNVTQACDLRCSHCYAGAGPAAKDELSTAEGVALIDDLAGFGVPVILFSGGEPLARADIFELLSHAVSRGVRAVLSTNGTRIDGEVASRLAEIGLSYVGISLDGIGETNDRFRGVPGAYEKALAGIRACRKAGVSELALAPDGAEEALQWALEMSLESTIGMKVTCAPHSVRIWKQMRTGEDTSPATGCMAGCGFVFISHRGRLQPCGFLDIACGDLRAVDFDFRKAYEDSAVFGSLRDVPGYKGKCGACEFVEACGGCRARAYAATGDFLDEEPSCSYRPRTRRRETVTC